MLLRLLSFCCCSIPSNQKGRDRQAEEELGERNMGVQVCMAYLHECLLSLTARQQAALDEVPCAWPLPPSHLSVPPSALRICTRHMSTPHLSTPPPAHLMAPHPAAHRYCPTRLRR